ncbi:protein N-terminal glutamine amidohydrolase-like [Vespula pensylvanica]|uniref:protein N-terminal glutamine amidohydrolase-like n=1 Tax=Vespula pensylvanica TaxID=30213 RepID=UPI001CBA4039|nr:protein N-terminal glutamine amidohydrolase-like [Vespula pensylvanica]XP_050844950.1 protein N-terminal glutamine amidohydrolase-like [Vespula vulgaris]
MAPVNGGSILKFAKISDKAFAPTKGSALAAGYDLRSAYECVIPARDRGLVKTDIQVQLPPGTYGRIAPRSGLALKNFIDVGAGVIDADYREENVWKLCQDVATKHGSELQHCHVAFISNSRRSVPLWRQRAGKDEDKLVVWDYHVILIYAPDERAVVYDLDSALPFPTHFWKYATETFRSDEALRPEYHRRFRLVPASLYLQQFASNRQHMKREDGTWIKTPPDYPPISTPTCKDNLDSFINMDPSTGLGTVMSLKQLVNRFYRPNVNTPASPSPQTQATPT